jgi:hypothetical protein
MSPTKTAAAVFVHGLAKKPAPEKLKELWLLALSRDNPRPETFPPPNKGVHLGNAGVPQLFNYYADVFYGTDYDTDISSYFESDLFELESEVLGDLQHDQASAAPATPREVAFVAKFEAKLMASSVLMAQPDAPQAAVPSAEYEIASWLPGPVKQAIIKKAAMEAYYFLFDKEYARADGVKFPVRRELRQRLLNDLTEAAGTAEKTIIVSHSMGTMVAYDVLRNVPACPPVEMLITLGSPLGIKEVQDELVSPDADGVDFPARKLEHWINIYDPLDPICGADPRFANDYKVVDGKAVVDVRESNWGKWRHSISHYLAGTEFRRTLSRAIGLQLT